MKNIWLILPVIIIVLFVSSDNIEPMVTDSYSYQVFDGFRPPLYPLLFKIFGQHIIVLQSVLWLIIAYIIFRKTDYKGLILYCSTIGLLFLSQKVLPETLFGFLITMAFISNRNLSFGLICLTLLVKPVMVFFLPVAYIVLRPDRAVKIIGAMAFAVGVYYVIKVSIYLGNNHWHGIGNYFLNIGRNIIGKTVGVEDVLWQRLTQFQTLCYVFMGITLTFFSKKNLLMLLPLYLVLMSGFAPNQGDRLIIIIAPICLLFLYQAFNGNYTSKLKQ